MSIQSFTLADTAGDEPQLSPFDEGYLDEAPLSTVLERIAWGYDTDAAWAAQYAAGALARHRDRIDRAIALDAIGEGQ